MSSLNPLQKKRVRQGRVLVCGKIDIYNNTGLTGLLYRVNSEGMNQCHLGSKEAIGPPGSCTKLRPHGNESRSLLDRVLDNNFGIELAEIDTP